MNGANYSSGDDYVVEFLGYRFSFNAADFEQRVTAAAVKLGLLDVAWDEERSDFGYRDPRGEQALMELLPVPSWHDVQFRR